MTHGDRPVRSGWVWPGAGSVTKKTLQVASLHPKRQQKIPLNDVHQRATSFYTFLRWVSRWAPKRGPMGALPPRDILNMDESPLALFGDQAKRSINDINTCNEVEGCLSNKVSTFLFLQYTTNFLLKVIFCIKFTDKFS